MKPFILTERHSIANQFLLEMRDRTIQQDARRFRKNMERLGEIMAYEISKALSARNVEVETPLAKTSMEIIAQQPVLVTVLRAGLPYFAGFQNYFDHSECGFIGAYRKEEATDLKINLDYMATPGLEGRDLILVDPMLATGKSFVKSIKSMLDRGTPKHIYIAALVAAPEGIEYIRENVKIPFSIWTVAVDEKLNEKFYIVPGLGDAGDLSFGEKL